MQHGLKEIYPRHGFAKAEPKGGGQVSDRNRKLVTFCIYIYADAKNSKIDSPFVEDSLRQDTSYLPIGNQNIVWPFELRLYSSLLDC
jgi:hypothetical protein